VQNFQNIYLKEDFPSDTNFIKDKLVDDHSITQYVHNKIQVLKNFVGRKLVQQSMR